jgi:hypothetical protein
MQKVIPTHHDPLYSDPNTTRSSVHIEFEFELHIRSDQSSLTHSLFNMLSTKSPSGPQ